MLDEIEKAHNDVFNILLQVLDDGRLTDNHGNTIDFTNTIIVMTSNLGSHLIQKITEEGGSEQEMSEAVEQVLQAKFLPELLNRIDERIVFHPLAKDQIREIVDLQIEHLATRMAKQTYRLEVTDAARDAITVDGYDPKYGARPLKRVIQRQLENPLATLLLKNETPDFTTILIDHDELGYSFKTVEQSETSVQE